MGAAVDREIHHPWAASIPCRFEHLAVQGDENSFPPLLRSRSERAGSPRANQPRPISPARDAGQEILTTSAQLAANRENAQLSTGPRTPEGKRRSSLNAFRHGLTAQIVVPTPTSAQAKPLCAVGNDEAAFKKHCDGIREALAPVGALEIDLAQAIAEDRWRLNRARALENSIFALGQSENANENSGHPEVDAALAQGRTWLAHARELNLLTTYENRIRRAVEKNTAKLRALQAARKAAVAKAEEEALALVRRAQYEQEDYDPTEDFPSESQPVGFVFSKPAIERQIEHRRRLARANAHLIKARGGRASAGLQPARGFSLALTSVNF